MSKDRIGGYDPSKYGRELRIAVIFVFVAFLIIVVRVIFLQVIKGNELFEKSINNSIRERNIIAVRGSIVDCNGEVLAGNQPSYNLVFFHGAVPDVDKLWETFKEIYAPNQPPFEIDMLKPKKGRGFAPVRLEKNVSRGRLAMIEARAFELPGVSIEVVPTRVYERGATIAHLVGYLSEIGPDELKGDTEGNYKLGDVVGKKGIEKTLDLLLRGEDGAEQLEVNVRGREEKVLGRFAPVAGHNAILNVDARVQSAIYTGLGSRKGAAVMLNVNDGAVLALVSTPSFDPNMFSGSLSVADWAKIASSPAHPLENRAVSGLYPPASTYKPFIAIAALEERVVDKDSSVYCGGSVEIGGNIFRCWKKEGHGRVSLYRAIVESCDVYFYNIGKNLSVDVIAKYARAFGFGSVTGIDLDREKRGLVPTREWKINRFKRAWMLGDTISVVIGQGYNSATPLQLAVSFAAIANGGILWRPQVVKRLESVDGRIVKKFTPEKMSEFTISPETLSLVRKGLWGVVNDVGGTGALARIPGIEVCGKTGTAQVVSLPREEKGKKKRPPTIQDHALFIAYAPCNNPEVAIAVVVENAGHGGAVAAPIARAGLEAYFKRKREKATGGNASVSVGD